jgi:Ca-activated chloride channel family protein
MRYKHPEKETSQGLAQPLPAAALGKELSADFRFAAAAASFAMLLRDSPHRGLMTYPGVRDEAAGCIGADPHGHRKAFLTLVQRAMELTVAPKATGPAQDGG